ncbi:MAG TPA: porphobilinogen synthase [Blastocatellia bacterium]|nr:porphobilinogen synthase [Blastocatellia bacterium]
MTESTRFLIQDRPRRLRRTAALRALVRETRIDPDKLVQPFFVGTGEGVRREIPSMPGQFNLSIDTLVDETRIAVEAGVRSVILFGLPETKDAIGTGAFVESGVVQKALHALRSEFPELVLIADTCLCEYTDHGHCGPLVDGEVDNDATLVLLGRTAVSQAAAGADIIAPSGMMDGMVGAIRDALDEAGFERTPVMSYAVKYASAYYGPFRDAADSAPQFGDRRGYQMDPANRREGLREAGLDVEQGADILMVKPAVAYLDVIREVRDTFDLPVAAYQVSGEYAMIKAAAANGWIDEQRIVDETLTSITRAGADIILTYYATEVSRRLRG